MGSVELDALLGKLSVARDENLLVGWETQDDGGVYRLSNELALVVSTDIITPPTDDPQTFGRVAAANAMSDIYAMGGTPVTCLNILAFPAKKLGQEVMAGIIAGAAEKIAEAGAVLAGGHSIDDPEPKFGLAVTGTVHPDAIWRNSTARVGDVLILTKPVGSGVILNANLKGWVSAADLRACIDVLEKLNRTAAEVASAFPVSAATDVTGFGLACHALEMARGAGVCLRFDYSSIPLLSGSRAMYERGMTTGSNAGNRRMAGESVTFDGPRAGSEQELVFDPQTNGGLLMAVREDAADALLVRLRDAGVETASRIGMVLDAQGRPRVEFAG